MVNKSGAIAAKAEYNKKLYRQITKPVLFSGIACVICGATLLALQIFSFEVIILVCGIIILICGLFFIGIYFVGGFAKFVTAKSVEIELYRDYMLIKVFQPDGTVSGIEKVYYGSLVKRRECKDYFLAYISKSAVYPIGKDGLSSAELNGVRLVLGLTQKSGDGQAVIPPSAPAENIDEIPQEGTQNYSDNED